MAKSKIFETIFFIFITFLIFIDLLVRFFTRRFFMQINETHLIKYSLIIIFKVSMLYVYPYGGYTEFLINFATTIGSYFPKFSILIDVF